MAAFAAMTSRIGQRLRENLTAKVGVNNPGAVIRPFSGAGEAVKVAQTFGRNS